ncbi:MAG: terminase small subunit [Butyrivibrio sp.]|nr:terminase small subunit [Butyrivibrio sp.]
MDKAKEKLTERQKAFCEYYIESLNATEAAIKAGYSKKTARAIGAENLTKPYIQEYIHEVVEKLRSGRIADADEVLSYLTQVMRGELKDQDNKAASLYDRTRAAELLGKRHRLFIDKQEVSASVDAVTIINDIPRSEDGDQAE